MARRPGGGVGKCEGGCGTVYALSPRSSGEWAKTTLYSFEGSKTDGYYPFDNVIFDPDGNLYATTQRGGAYDYGTVFELTPGAGGKWTETILYDFGTDKGNIGVPQAALLRDKAGNFSSTAGEPYELSPKAGGRWREHVLYRFHPHTGKNGTDGSGSDVPLIFDSVGNLYGTTEAGGNYSLCLSGGEGCGTVFELTLQADGEWKEHVLHRFAQFANDGELPMAGLVMDTSGNLYGTTMQGGSFHNQNVCLAGCGTVFELTKDAGGNWKEIILHSFNSGQGGSGPVAPLVLDKAGNLYGTASAGGLQDCVYGCGVVFKLTPEANGKWKYSVVHRFNAKDGAYPEAGLTLDAKGNLYGTTFWGGTYQYGVVFEITP